MRVGAARAVGRVEQSPAHGPVDARDLHVGAAQPLGLDGGQLEHRLPLPRVGDVLARHAPPQGRRKPLELARGHERVAIGTERGDVVARARPVELPVAHALAHAGLGRALHVHHRQERQRAALGLGVHPQAHAAVGVGGVVGGEGGEERELVARVHGGDDLRAHEVHHHLERRRHALDGDVVAHLLGHAAIPPEQPHLVLEHRDLVAAGVVPALAHVAAEHQPHVGALARLEAVAHEAIADVARGALGEPERVGLGGGLGAAQRAVGGFERPERIALAGYGRIAAAYAAEHELLALGVEVGERRGGGGQHEARGERERQRAEGEAHLGPGCHVFGAPRVGREFLRWARAPARLGHGGA